MNDNNITNIINYGICQISPNIEMKRDEIIIAMKEKIAKELVEFPYNKIDVNNFFPKWLMYQLNASNYNVDPVIPYRNIDNTSLIRDFYFLSEKQLSMDNIHKKIKNLNLDKRCIKATNEILNYSFSDKYMDNINQYSLVIEDEVIDGYMYETYTFLPSRKLFKQATPIKYPLLKTIVQKCLNKYNGIRDTRFNTLMLCIILRYNTLNSYNQQLAIHPEFLTYLQNDIGIECECFASAINHYFPHYFSLYYDLEMFVGSKGNIFQTILTEGIYWANPPYDEQIIKLFVLKLIADFKTDSALTVLLNIPVWDKKNYDGFEALTLLRDSGLITHEFVIPKKKAKYYNYYLNKVIYPADVYILLVQNSAGRQTYNIKDKLARAIREYFP